MIVVAYQVSGVVYKRILLFVHGGYIVVVYDFAYDERMVTSRLVIC